MPIRLSCLFKSLALFATRPPSLMYVTTPPPKLQNNDLSSAVYEFRLSYANPPIHTSIFANQIDEFAFALFFLVVYLTMR